MNELVNITQGHALTMSSLEIAGLTGKAHRHVLRDIRKMLDGLDEADTFAQNWAKVSSGGGRPLEVVTLPKRETLIKAHRRQNQDARFQLQYSTNFSVPNQNSPLGVLI